MCCSASTTGTKRLETPNPADERRHPLVSSVVSTEGMSGHTSGKKDSRNNESAGTTVAASPSPTCIETYAQARNSGKKRASFGT